MKNALKIALVALTVTAFAACKGNGSSSTDTLKVDSTKKDSVVKIDSTKVDTAKKDTTKK